MNNKYLALFLALTSFAGNGAPAQAFDGVVSPSGARREVEGLPRVEDLGALRGKSAAKVSKKHLEAFAAAEAPRAPYVVDESDGLNPVKNVFLSSRGFYRIKGNFGFGLQDDVSREAFIKRNENLTSEGLMRLYDAFQTALLPADLGGKGLSLEQAREFAQKAAEEGRDEYSIRVARKPRPNGSRPARLQ